MPDDLPTGPVTGADHAAPRRRGRWPAGSVTSRACSASPSRAAPSTAPAPRAAGGCSGRVTRPVLAPAFAAGRGDRRAARCTPTGPSRWSRCCTVDRRRRPARRRRGHDVPAAGPLPARGDPAVPAAAAVLAPPAPGRAAAVERQRRRRGDLAGLRAAADGARRRRHARRRGRRDARRRPRARRRRAARAARPCSPPTSSSSGGCRPLRRARPGAAGRTSPPSPTRASRAPSSSRPSAARPPRRRASREVSGRAARRERRRRRHPRHVRPGASRPCPTLGTLAVLAVGTWRVAAGRGDHRRRRPGGLPALPGRRSRSARWAGCSASCRARRRAGSG